MIKVGITGSFATGKSEVTKAFRDLGAEAIDSDRIVHLLLRNRTSTQEKVVKAFGKKILAKDGSIDRKKLGRIVFEKRTLIQKLNGIVHPAVIYTIKSYLKLLELMKKDCVVVVDAPLLIEAGAIKLVDKVIVVRSTLKNQLRRAQKKFGLKRSDALKRIKLQMPLKEKVRHADFIIDNNGSLKDLKREVGIIWTHLNMGDS